jgi:3-deoxy-D-manno-octulosonic-acid transferase
VSAAQWADRPLSLRLYGAVTGLAEPLATGGLKSRARRGKEDPRRIAERLGHASAARPDGRLAWVHGASVGESLSLLPLIEALRERRPDATVLVTSGTRTSADLLAKRLPKGVIHQYLPVDAPGAVARFMDHWRPDLGVLVESELWPNLLHAAARQGVRMALLSAKLSEKSFANWKRTPKAALMLLSGFELILAQDARSANRLESLGASISGTADLKFGAEALPADAEALDALSREIGARPVLLAASTHNGEDPAILRRFSAIAGLGPDAPLLVIVPRHPDRGPGIAASAENQGLATGRQGAGQRPTAGTQVFVADVMGELGLWFRLARIALIGGSLVDGVGGHNPLEAARLGCAIATGPYVANWASAYRTLDSVDGVLGVNTGEAMDEAFRRAIAGDGALADMSARAQALVARRDAEARGVIARVLALLP